MSPRMIAYVPVTICVIGFLVTFLSVVVSLRYKKSKVDPKKELTIASALGGIALLMHLFLSKTNVGESIASNTNSALCFAGVWMFVSAMTLAVPGQK